jgi:hypothetical protein
MATINKNLSVYDKSSLQRKIFALGCVLQSGMKK